MKQLVRSEEGRELQGQDPRRPEQNVFDFRTLTNPSQVSVCSSHPSLSVGPSTVSTSQPSISSHNHMPNLSIPPPSLANQSGLPSLANQNSPQFSRNNSIDQVKKGRHCLFQGLWKTEIKDINFLILLINTSLALANRS